MPVQCVSKYAMPLGVVSDMCAGSFGGCVGAPGQSPGVDSIDKSVQSCRTKRSGVRQATQIRPSFLGPAFTRQRSLVRSQ
jgi:hypothetical protein